MTNLSNILERISQFTIIICIFICTGICTSLDIDVITFSDAIRKVVLVSLLIGVASLIIMLRHQIAGAIMSITLFIYYIVCKKSHRHTKSYKMLRKCRKDCTSNLQFLAMLYVSCLDFFCATDTEA